MEETSLEKSSPQNYVNEFNYYYPPEFDEVQKAVLSQYFTNLDKPVYAIKSAMPVEVAGALISRFSRSDIDPRTLFWKEFLKNPELGMEYVEKFTEENELDEAGQKEAKERAAKFFENAFDKYGDESVAEIATVHVIVEKASQIPIKVIENNLPRAAFIEQSTRYIPLTKKIEGKYPYFRPSALMRLLGDEFEKRADALYDFHVDNFHAVKKHIEDNNPKLETDTETGYKSSVNARVNDVEREALILALRATVGVAANGRDWSDLINIMLSDPREEVRAVGQMILNEVSEIIPNIMKRTTGNHGEALRNYYTKRDSVLEKHLKTSTIGLLNVELQETDENIITAKILSLSDNPVENIAASIMYEQTNIDYEILLNHYIQNPNEAESLLKELSEIRDNRFQKVLNAFGTIRIKTEFTAPWSSWKDLSRHRKLLQLNKPYFIGNNFYTAPEIKAMGLYTKYNELMRGTLNYIDKVKQEYPELIDEIEYLVPQGASYKWVMDMGFDEAAYLIELRSAESGHESYRKVVQEFYKSIEKQNATLAQIIKHVNMNEVYLGRRTAFNKIVRKGSSIE